jgi:hypothetical protein
MIKIFILCAFAGALCNAQNTNGICDSFSFANKLAASATGILKNAVMPYGTTTNSPSAFSPSAFMNSVPEEVPRKWNRFSNTVYSLHGYGVTEQFEGDQEWFTETIVETANIPACNAFQCVFHLGRALQSISDIKVSLDATPPKISFFVSEAAASLTNGISEEVASLLAGNIATSTIYQGQDQANGFPWAPMLREFSGIETSYTSVGGLVQFVGECFPHGWIAKKGSVTFNLYPKELYVVEYARFLNRDPVVSVIKPHALAYEIHRAAYPDRSFIVASPKAHFEAWPMFNTYDNVSNPAWIAEVERIIKLGDEKQFELKADENLRENNQGKHSNKK